MKDKKWKDMIEKHGELRFFSSMAIKKSHKGQGTSAQELDMLFRDALSKEKVTPGYLKDAMGISKTIIKENMTEEDFEQLFKLIRQANKILAK